jgi:hypothetical protein
MLFIIVLGALVILVTGVRLEALAGEPYGYVASVGHADAFHAKLESGQLSMFFAYDSQDQLGQHEILADPADVLLHVVPEAETVIPEGLPPSYGFLGQPGDPIWIIPETRNPDVIWAGLSTQDLQPDEWADLQLTFVDLAGPGDLFTWVTDPVGEAHEWWNSNALPQSLAFPPATHAHFNWAFTAEGDYVLSAMYSGTHNTLGALTTGAVEYHIHVGALGSVTASPSPTVSQTPLPSPSLTPAPTVTPTSSPAPVESPTPDQTGTPSPITSSSPKPERFVWGNWNCGDSSEVAESILVLLQSVAAISHLTVTDCPDIGDIISEGGFTGLMWGDGDCDSVITTKDALLQLLWLAGIATAGDNCPTFGDLEA